MALYLSLTLLSILASLLVYLFYHNCLGLGDSDYERLKRVYITLGTRPSTISESDTSEKPARKLLLE
jgi:hypothetical protein